MAHDPNLDFYSFSIKETAAESTEQPTPPELRLAPETVRATRHTSSRVGWGVLILCLVWIALTEIVYAVVLSAMPAWRESNVFLSLASSLPLYLVAMPMTYLFLRRMPTAIPERRIAADKRIFALLPCAIALLYGGNIIGNAVMSLISTATGYNFSSSLEVSLGMPLWVSALLVVFVAPVMEELIFRKLLIDRLLPLGEYAAVVLSALLFATFHFNLYQFFYAGLIGALLALIYLRTGSIRLCIALHACVNFLGGVLPMGLMELADYDSLLVLLSDPDVTADALLSFLNANGFGVGLLLGYLFLMGLTAIVGVVLLFVFRKRLSLVRRDDELPPKARNAALFGNAGMIVFFVFAVVFTITTMVATAVSIG